LKPSERVTVQSEGTQVTGRVVDEHWLLTDDGRFVPYDQPREGGTPGTERCASCGKTLTRDEELESTILGLAHPPVATFICEDCKTPY
jgi:hypothetical protein